MKEMKVKRGTEKLIPFRPQIKKVTNGIKKSVRSIRISISPDEPNYFTIA